MPYRRIISTRLMTSVLLVAIAAAGPDCLPKRIYWSPDGSKAVILTEEKVYLSDGEGRLAPALPASFEQVAWFPGSKRMVAVSLRELSTWSEVQPLLAPEQAAVILRLAPAFREQVLAHGGKFDNWQPDLKEPISPVELLALWIHIREQRPEELRERLGAEWERLAGINLSARQLQLCDIDQGIVRGQVVTETLYGIASDSLRVSPDGEKIAYVLKDHFLAQEGESPQLKALVETGGTLMIVSTRSSAPPRTVEPFAAWRSGFTPDSKALVYATTKPVPRGESLVLGSIERRRIVDEQGNLSIAEPDQLAGIIYLPDTSVVCLEDGKILFSAANVTLPTATADLPRGASLFCIEPDKRATIAPMLTRSAESTAPLAGFEYGIFDVRPDGDAVTLFGGEKDGEVGWYSFTTGAVSYVIPGGQDWQLLERPTWRSNDELSLIVPPGHEWGSPERCELVLYSLQNKQARRISTDWPDELMDSWKPPQRRGKPSE